MTTSYDLPMPNDFFYTDAGIGKVVASCYLNDDTDEVTGLLLVLNRRAPFYTVTEILTDDGDEWFSTWESSRENINEAVALFAESGGDA